MSVLLKWFPPSWFRIIAEDKIMYIDPAYLRTYFTKYPKGIEFSRWPDPIDGLPEELEKGDAILVTHDHNDHGKDVTVNRLRRSDTLLIAPKRCTKKLGKDIKAIQPGDEVSFGDMKIKAVHAYNTEQGRSTRKIHHKGNGVGYLIKVEGRTIYHAGDTDLIAEMKELGDVHVALLPIGGTFTMDIQEAVEATVTINPQIVIPMHRLKADPQELKDRLDARSDIEVVPLQIGEVYELK